MVLTLLRYFMFVRLPRMSGRRLFGMEQILHQSALIQSELIWANMLELWIFTLLISYFRAQLLPLDSLFHLGFVKLSL